MTLNFINHYCLRRLTLVTLLVLFSGPLTLPPVHAASISAEEIIRSTASKAMMTLRKDHELFEKDPEQLYRVIENYILPHFDFISMSRLVLGKHWRRATIDQRKRFVKEFRSLLIRTYASALLKYRDRTLQLLPSRKQKRPGRTEVRTKVNIDGGKSVTIDYSLYDKKGQWKVYDVRVGGVSLVVNYRSSFMNEINQAGGLDPLIKRLAELNRNARAG